MNVQVVTTPNGKLYDFDDVMNYTIDATTNNLHLYAKDFPQTPKFTFNGKGWLLVTPTYTAEEMAVIRKGPKQ